MERQRERGRDREMKRQREEETDRQTEKIQTLSLHGTVKEIENSRQNVRQEKKKGGETDRQTEKRASLASNIRVKHKSSMTNRSLIPCSKLKVMRQNTSHYFTSQTYCYTPFKVFRKINSAKRWTLERPISLR